MANNTIGQGANTPINVRTGTIPDVGGSMTDWFQPLTFCKVTKSVVGFQDVETEVQINFRGIVQPFTDRQLLLKPEGQRAWTWLMINGDPVLSLDVDEIVLFLGIQTRIMSLKRYDLYGYIEYHAIQDFTGSDPTVSP
jgi:hypothetical protein